MRSLSMCGGVTRRSARARARALTDAGRAGLPTDEALPAARRRLRVFVKKDRCGAVHGVPVSS